MQKTNDHIRDIMQFEIDNHLKNLNVYGFSVIKNYMDRDLVNFLLKIVNENYNKIENQFDGRPNRDKNDKMVYHIQNKDKKFIDLISSDVISKIAMQKLNDRYFRWLPETDPNYILHYYNARSGGSHLDLHIDTFIPFLGEHTIAMQFVFVLNDMDQDNGCTVVVPGSHLSGKYTDREIEEKKPIIANAGDLVMWDSRLWHGTEKNKSKADRWALIATFTQWWVKQKLDISKSLPSSIYSQCTNKQKALLGFCSLPPVDENDRINTKTGYESLKENIEDYR